MRRDGFTTCFAIGQRLFVQPERNARRATVRMRC